MIQKGLKKRENQKQIEQINNIVYVRFLEVQMYIIRCKGILINFFLFGMYSLL